MSTVQPSGVSVRRRGGGVGPKWIVLGIVVVLLAILVFQNTQDVLLRVFFWEFTASAYLMLLAAAVLGFVVGLGVSALLRRRSSRRR